MAENVHPGLYRFGVVAKAQGIRGGFLIEGIDPGILTDQLKVVYIRSSEKQWVPYRVMEIRPHVDRRRNLFFVILEGIETRTQAESLRGHTVMSDYDMMPAMDNQVSIIGYRVIRVDGSLLGTVTDIMETAAYEIFVVKVDQKHIMIPHVDEFVQDICEETEIVTVRNTAELEALV